MILYPFEMGWSSTTHLRFFGSLLDNYDLKIPKVCSALRKIKCTAAPFSLQLLVHLSSESNFNWCLDIIFRWLLSVKISRDARPWLQEDGLPLVYWFPRFYIFGNHLDCTFAQDLLYNLPCPRCSWAWWGAMAELYAWELNTNPFTPG